MAYAREDSRISELEKAVAAGEISKDAIRKTAGISLNDTSGVFGCFWKEKKEMPLVSVVMSVYNGEKFVAETIESVLNKPIPI